jgi:hypothetical protein
MTQTSNIVKRRGTRAQDKRILFVLHEDLLNQIRQVADENHVSVSHFLREAARRSISAYKKAATS